MKRKSFLYLVIAVALVTTTAIPPAQAGPIKRTALKVVRKLASIIHTAAELVALAGMVVYQSADTAIQRDLDREFNQKAVEEAAKAEEVKGDVLDAGTAEPEEVTK